MKKVTDYPHRGQLPLEPIRAGLIAVDFYVTQYPKLYVILA